MTTVADADRDRFSAWLRGHGEPSFTGAVEHRFAEGLAGVLDTLTGAEAPRCQRRVARLFRRTADLEAAFFDQAYEVA